MPKMIIVGYGISLDAQKVERQLKLVNTSKVCSLCAKELLGRFCHDCGTDNRMKPCPMTIKDIINGMVYVLGDPPKNISILPFNDNKICVMNIMSESVGLTMYSSNIEYYKWNAVEKSVKEFLGNDLTGLGKLGLIGLEKETL